MIDVLNKYSGRPFHYGADCCQFAGEVVESFTGQNPMAGFFYSNKREAYKIIKGMGGLEAAITQTLGDPYDGSKDGDVCLIDTDLGPAAAVVFRGAIVAREQGGLIRYPLDAAIKVWPT